VDGIVQKLLASDTVLNGPESWSHETHRQGRAGHPGPFISLPLARLREIVQLNVVAHLELAHHFGRKLAARGRGGIVLVSAAAAVGGLPYMANDSATKAYPLNLGEALHVEPGGAGVDVTVLAPLVVNTGVVARMGKDRTEALIAHMRKMIRDFGDEADRAALEEADAELAERRSRKGGRPRKAES